MDYIQYILKDNDINIYGTNQFIDLFVSLNCLPKKGWHRGVYKEAMKLSNIPFDKNKIVYLSGHSMGGAIAQCLAYILLEKGFNVKVNVCGSYPITLHKINIDGQSRIYGNDPIPALFPWFRHVCKKKYEGPKRWFPFVFKDHMEY